MSENTPHIKKVLVFCGAQEGNNPVFKEQAQALGRMLAENGYELVYGGGAAGLMGAVSEAALKAGGKVKGIIPKIFQKAGAASQGGSPDGVDEDIVETIMIRKDRMILESDAAIAIPGGFGTLDEIYEMIVAQELKVYNVPDKPVQPMIVVNVGGFFNGIREQLRASVEAGFIRPGRADLITFVDTVEDAVKLLNEANSKAPVPSGAFARKPAPSI